MVAAPGIPEFRVPHGPRAGWESIDPLPPFRRVDGSAVEQATVLRVWQDGEALHARFDCVDSDVWATHTERNAPLWEEEVVELFLAPGAADPIHYAEIEVNPLGAVFDALVHSPHGDRRGMTVDRAWDCHGLVAGAEPSAGGWRAWLSIPWDALASLGPRADVWRANFYRIERPRGGRAEFSCWSPTHTDPPDFHRPARFGRLLL